MCSMPSVAIFCSSLISCFPDMLLSYFLNDLEMVPVALVSTGITFIFTLHMRCISIVGFLCVRIFSAYFLITFLSPELLLLLLLFFWRGRGLYVTLKCHCNITPSPFPLTTCNKTHQFPFSCLMLMSWRSEVQTYFVMYNTSAWPEQESLLLNHPCFFLAKFIRLFSRLLRSPSTDPHIFLEQFSTLTSYQYPSFYCFLFWNFPCHQFQYWTPSGVFLGTRWRLSYALNRSLPLARPLT